MKPQLLKIATPDDSSFNLYEQEVPFFATPWHYHPEVEIVLVKESTGEKFIGSSITEFKPGDLTMIGSYLPHFYKNAIEYYDEKSTAKAKSTVVHFLEDFIGADFLEIPENYHLKNLLTNSRRGLQFGKTFTDKIRSKIEALTQLSGPKKLLALLDILYEMSQTDDVVFLTSEPMVLTNQVDSDRMKRVFEYVMQNFHKEIRLQDVADLAYMSESAFSRYFKKRTRKSFSTFLTEIRIEHACKLLQKDQLSVSEVSYQSGFKNLSNFNRQFKGLKKTTPLNYRTRFI